VKLDKERLEKYLDQIAAETIDIEKIIGKGSLPEYIFKDGNQ